MHDFHDGLSDLLAVGAWGVLDAPPGYLGSADWRCFRFTPWGLLQSRGESEEREESQKLRLKDLIESLNDYPQLESWHYEASRLLLVPQRRWNSTAAVDGTHFFYNPEFCEALTDAAILFLICHETWHIQAKHLWRMQRMIAIPEDKYPDRETDLEQQIKYALEMKTNRKRANVAADLAIHGILKPDIDSCKFPGRFIPNCLFSEKYLDWAMEEVYEDLLQNEPPSNQVPLDIHIMIGEGSAPQEASNSAGETPGEGEVWVVGVDQDGELIDIGQAMDDAPGDVKTEEQRDAEVAEKRQALGGKNQGFGKGRDVKIPEVKTPKKTRTLWRARIEDVVTQAARTKYSYRRLHRGYLQQGLVVPRLTPEMLTWVIGVDVSGSINDDVYRMFGDEVENLRSQLPEHLLHLFWCSNKIHRELDVASGTKVDWTFRGTGGTDFRPVFDRVEKLNIIPQMFVYFTDCMGTFPAKEPSFPVLWMKWGRSRIKPPFGRLVEMDNSKTVTV